MQAHQNGRLFTGIDHYENFPVASVLVPRRLRPAVIALYRFARYADDVADEGDQAPSARLAELDRLEDALVGAPGATHPVVAALAPHLAAQSIPREHCLALLSAFRQDVVVQRYPDDASLLDYCTRSANPVGRMLLALFDRDTAQTKPLSDAICTALQLVNFLQDIRSDWERGRVYLPATALAAEGIGEQAIAEAIESGRSGPALRRCIRTRALQARALLESGAPLMGRVPLRLSLELRATLAGAVRILELLQARDFDPIAHRPRLGWRDAGALLRLMIRPSQRRAPTASPTP